MKLSELKPGNTARITSVGGEGTLRQHLLDMGVIPGAELTVVQFAPMGDPVEIRIHGYELTLRMDDASRITVIPTQTAAASGGPSREQSDALHPGLGEGGKYHLKDDPESVPKGTALRFALAGNQNCGKTTLFNQLTGANQHVGNFPGVTIDRKDGEIRNYGNCLVTDLPGIYSLSPYSGEELVSRQFILEEKPSCIINIVDATSIERNLYLTLQLLTLGRPMVLALNMMDEMRGNGGTVRINEMEEMLGIPVVPISASKNEGVDELMRHAYHLAAHGEVPVQKDLCTDASLGGAVHRCIHGIMHLIDDHASAAGIPLRFAAEKLVEGDSLVLDALGLSDNEKDMLEHILVQLEEECGMDRSAAIAGMRYDFIRDLCDATVIKPSESREHLRSRKIDRILTGKYTALPCFILIMGLTFMLSFNVIGAWLQGILEELIEGMSMMLDASLSSAGVNEVVRSLAVDGIIGGIGSVLSFIPIILVLFFFLSVMEDSGYMARIAFVTDTLLRKVGLSGRSIVPMLIGFGCTVPGVMASRTLPSERDRKMTVLMTPFMSCTAKVPIYVMFSSLFFPEHSALVMAALYLLGIVLAVLLAFASKNTVFRGEAVPFVMELPNYRMPGASNVARLLWEKAKDFIQRAFTVIFAASVVVWLLRSFDFGLNYLGYDSSSSMLCAVAAFIAPVFGPLGFGDWRISTALVTGFLAKESVVSTLEVLMPQGLGSILTPGSVIPLLVFCLLYTPCVAAVASIRREMGGKWAFGVVVGQCALAWIVALAARGLCLLAGVV
ncbi:MAG: ferrous iron transport protein B [Eubacteriaceae bacterium]|nr:ferrous iron transport protein B [Eubacteriaceae bacterium]